MPSDSKSVRSAKSTRSTRSNRSRKSTRSHHHDNNYAVTSDDESVPSKATFSHRSKRSSTPSQGSDDDSSVHKDAVSDEEGDDIGDSLEEDSTLRISSVLMSNTNVMAEKQPSGKGTTSACIEEYGEEEGIARDMEDGNDTDDDISEPSQQSETPTSRSGIIKKIETRAVHRRDANTAHMGDIIDYLENAIYAAKNLDNLNMLEEMEAWRDKAMVAEKRQEEMAEEIACLKKEVKMWHGRTRRAEKRCERIQSGMEDKKTTRKNFCGTSSLADDVSNIMSENGAEVSKGYKSGLKAVLRGTSFRQKWDRKRIAGIEEVIKEQNSDGESTVAAREYVNQYLESNPKHAVAEIEERDNSLVQVRSPSRGSSIRSSGTKKSAQRFSMERPSQHQALVPPVSTLEDNDSSWVEMLSI